MSMLPNPVTSKFRARGKSFLGPSNHHRSRRDILLSRARITNLGFLLLLSFASFSFLFNVYYYFSSPVASTTLRPPPLSLSRTKHSSSHVSHPGPDSILSTVARDEAVKRLTHLVIVPGHGIWKGTSQEDMLDEEKWALESYQVGGGRRVKAWVKHIQVGVELAKADDRALVIFSGGQTRQNVTTTEAESYHRIATLLLDPYPASLPLTLHKIPTTVVTTTNRNQNNYNSPSLPIHRRLTTELYALDSFQNLLFSIARFHEYTGRYPEQITIVGYEMKRMRFEDLHRKAVRWPSGKFGYVGIDAEGERDAYDGERQNGYIPYTQDTYGCHTDLQSKRRSRNPYFRFHPYHTSSPELRELLDWCPGSGSGSGVGARGGGWTSGFPGKLPWDTLETLD